VQVDSAGTHAYHVGQPPDARATAHALRRGLDLSSQRARQLTPADFSEFDLLLAMDWDNLALVEERCPPGARQKVQLLMSLAPDAASTVVPDPYYGGDAGFEEVLDLCEQACAALVAQLPQRLGRR
jgi:protein-tyrosine phosphatase